MSKVVVGMTISLDGFVNDRSGSVDSLYSDLESLRDSEPLRESIHKTGAVVMGKNAFAMSEDPDLYAYNYEFQVPIFVVTHAIPNKQPKETDKLSFTFVIDGVDSAIKQAKLAADNKEVTVIGGASTIRQCIKAGVADELHVDVMPILLCGGLRLFEDFGITPIQLERLNVVNLSFGRTPFKFRVVK
jgi:dihydrofolate reductase